MKNFRQWPKWAQVVAPIGALILACTVATSIGGGDEPTTPTLSQPTSTSSSSPVPGQTEVPVVEASTETTTVSQQQARISAENYLEHVGGFSRTGLINQLEYEGFSEADATWAVDSLGVDWMEQAAIKAASYMETVGGFSRSELIDQLEYEGFTTAEAEHGASSVGL